jgi:hypothetical protein
MTADDKPIVRVAFSVDGGKSFAAPLTVDADSPLGRGDAAFLSDGTLIIVWYAATHDPHLAARAYDPNSVAGPPLRIAPVSGSRKSGRPRIASSGGSAVVVWTGNQEGRPSLRSASLSR